MGAGGLLLTLRHPLGDRMGGRGVELVLDAMSRLEKCDALIQPPQIAPYARELDVAEERLEDEHHDRDQEEQRGGVGDAQRGAERVDEVGPQSKEQRQRRHEDPEQALPDVEVVAPDEVEDAGREDEAQDDDREVVALHRPRTRLQRARHRSDVSAMYQPTVHHEKKILEAPFLRGVIVTEISEIVRLAPRSRSSTPMS